MFKPTAIATTCSARRRNAAPSAVLILFVTAAALVAVRAEAGPFTPSDLAGLDLWLSADAGVTTAGGSVSQWDDQSLNGRDATQATPGSQPLHVLGALGGLPAVQFDGTDDKLFTATNTSPQTIFIVNRVATGAKTFAGIIGTNGADRGMRRYPDDRWRHPGDGNDFTNPAGSEFFIDGNRTSVVPQNTWHIVAAKRGSGTESYDVFGGYYGGREFAGDIAEVIVYDRALNTADRNRIGYYLEQKYGLDTAYAPVPASSPPVAGGLQLWLKADAIDATNEESQVRVSGADTFVRQWEDQVASNHATQNSTGRQPQYVAGALNGLPVVRFDGTDDQMVTASRADAQTIFIVNRVEPGAKSLAGLIGQSGDKGIRRISTTEWRHPGDANDFTNPAGSQFFVNGNSTSIAPEGTWHIAAAQRAGGTIDYDTLGGYYGGRELAGDYAEVMIYDRELSFLERSRVGAYLGAKWGIDYNAGISGLNLWLKADGGVTTSGGSVSQWDDQSGNFRDAVQANAARQPTHLTGALNGLPVVSFDGASSPDDDHLNFTSNATAQTIFLVNRVDPGAKSLAGIIGRDGADRGIRRYPADRWRYPGDGGDFTNPAGSQFFIDGSPTSVVAENTWHVASAVRSGGTESYSSLGGYYGGREFGGDIAEVLIFDRQLNAAERIVTENYLAAKYGLTLAANDFYAGDEPGKGDYDRGVIGIGSMSDGVHPAHGAAGLYLFENGGSLDAPGEFVMAGYGLEANAWVTTDLPHDANLRSDRIWYIDTTGDVDVELAFDLRAAGLPDPDTTWPYGLLYSPTGDPLAFETVPVVARLSPGLVSFDIPAGLLRDGYYALAVVPEPGAFVLLGLGAVLLLGVRRRRR